MYFHVLPLPSFGPDTYLYPTYGQTDPVSNTQRSPQMLLGYWTHHALATGCLLTVSISPNMGWISSAAHLNSCHRHSWFILHQPYISPSSPESWWFSYPQLRRGREYFLHLNTDCKGLDQCQQFWIHAKSRVDKYWILLPCRCFGFDHKLCRRFAKPTKESKNWLSTISARPYRCLFVKQIVFQYQLR